MSDYRGSKLTNHEGLRVRSTSFNRLVLENGFELVSFPLAHTVAVLPSYIVSLLAGCHQFRRIEEHLEAACARLGLDAKNSTSIREAFRQLQERGYLLPETCLSATATQKSPLVAVKSIGIVVSGRTRQIAKTLESFLEHARMFSRDVAFTIVDDVLDVTQCAARRQLLAEISRREHVRIGYAGIEEKEQFISALVKQGVDESVIRFGLQDPEGCGHSAGANRNALLLQHTGEVFFQADDDIACRVAVPAESTAELCFSSGYNPNSFRYFPDRESAIKAARFQDSDLLSEHEAMLGRSVGECVVSYGNIGSGERMQFSDIMLRLAISGRGRVAVTQNGLVGDCGFGACSGYLFLKGESRQHLHESWQNYRTATTSREISQAVESPTISDAPFCMSYALGLDNRILLPPFFPVRRNGDGVFATILRSCFDTALFGHVPVQILHEPVDARGYRPETIRESAEPQMTDIIRQIASTVTFGPVSEEQRRLAMMGRYLVDIASVPTPDFFDFVRQQVLGGVRRQVSGLQGLYKIYGRSPDYWVVDCEHYERDLLSKAAQPHYGVPADLRQTRTRDEALHLTKTLVRKFGELLVSWPGIVEATRILKNRGIRIARAVA